jgi:hypothetical protein
VIAAAGHVDEYSALQQALLANNVDVALAEIEKLKGNFHVCRDPDVLVRPPAVARDPDCGDPVDGDAAVLDPFAHADGGAHVELEVGVRVLVHGLATRDDLNGRQGVITAKLACDRWAVRLDAVVSFFVKPAKTAQTATSTSPVSLKSANLDKLSFVVAGT